MSRIRTIKPELWTNDRVLELSFPARLLFIGMWNFCDDGGVHIASIRKLKAEVFPGDEVSLGQVQGWMDEIIGQRLVKAFVADYQDERRSFWFVAGWDHQRIDKPYLKYPQYQADSASQTVPQPFADHSPTVPQPFADHSPQGVECSGVEGKGEEKAKSAASATAPLASLAEPIPAEPEPTAPASPEPTAPDQTARQAKTKPGKPPAEPLPEPPEWLPAATWQTYVDHRKAKGKAMTPSAATLTLKQLDKARGLGHDPVDMVESAIANGWTGCVFEKHHKPADTAQPVAAPTPRNGTRYPPFDKNARLLTGNQSAIEEWLGNRSPETRVIEGECHEVH